MYIDRFIERWSGSGGAERANYVSFLTDLCRVLDVPEPEPTRPDASDNAYVFEKGVADPHDDSKATVRRIDLYKRGCFVLEAKQGVEQEAQKEAEVRAASRKGRAKKGHGTRGTRGWDAFMQRARQQAESYVRLLPDGEGRPPFVLVVDVGHVIEVYAEFSRTGGVYRPFPDARTNRIRLEDLRDERVRERLRTVWLEPIIRASNPHIKFFNSSLWGFSTVEFTKSYCEYTAYSVNKSQNRNGLPAQVIRRLRVPSGQVVLQERPLAEEENMLLAEHPEAEVL